MSGNEAFDFLLPGPGGPSSSCVSGAGNAAVIPLAGAAVQSSGRPDWPLVVRARTARTAAPRQLVLWSAGQFWPGNTQKLIQYIIPIINQASSENLSFATKIQYKGKLLGY